MFSKALILLLTLQVGITAFAQSQENASVKTRLTNVTEYMNMDVKPDTLLKWSEWLTIGESPSAEVTARNAAWGKFFQSFYRNLGSSPTASINPQSLSQWSQFITNPSFLGQISDFRNFTSKEPAGPAVNISGSGSRTNIILIPPIGFSCNVYEELIKRYSGTYNFIEVSYPGSPGTRGYSFPQRADYVNADWLSRVDREIETSIERENIRDAVVVAMGSGLYTAIKLALHIPEKIKGIVSIHGQYVADMSDPASPGSDASQEYRKRSSEKFFPASLLVRFSPTLVTNNFSFTRNAVLNRKYSENITPDNVIHYFRYIDEFQAQDITGNVKKISVPILSLIANHDDLSPVQTNKNVHAFWRKVTTSLPELPVSVVTIENTRSAVFIDQPLLFDIYFEKFVKNPQTPIKSIVSEKSTIVDRASPSATISQTLGTLDIELSYSRPFKNGRKVFGELIPYGQVWRAGANEATSIKFSKNAMVSGHFVPKGDYSFFILPEKSSWTIILNQLADQWGAFNYQEKYDVLRFKVTPRESPIIQEALKFDFNNLSHNNVDLTMTWDNVQLSFQIEEAFELPVPPSSLLLKPWKKILDDGEGDGMVPAMTDGKSLSYFYDKKTDSVWFKFDLFKTPNDKAFALNIIIDADNNQNTGMAWFGTNTNFKFDKAITLWMRKEGDSFGGVNGITDINGITEGNWNKLHVNNIKYFIDRERKLYIAGFKRQDLNLTGKTIRIIGAVGEYMSWNDDIGDKMDAIVEFK